MKKFINIPCKTLQLIVLTVLITTSLPSSAHIVGISWADIGNETVRFYGETAHEGYEEAQGGLLRIGPWSSADLHYWTGAITDQTLTDLNVDGMAYWDPDGEFSTVAGKDYYNAHTGGAGAYNNFFYLDVANFTSGEYLLQLDQGWGPVDRAIATSYLTAVIEVATNVPEPPVFALFGIGLLAMFAKRKTKKI